MPPHTRTDRAPRPTSSQGAHHVEFYADDASLRDAVAEFFGPAAAKGVAVVVATPDHAELFRKVLEPAGPAAVSPRVIFVDAQRTLDRLMAQGRPQRDAFFNVIGGLLDGAAADGMPLRVYGEMVGVLWRQGNVEAAIALEDLWNEISRHHPFDLLCGYPVALFHQIASRPGLMQICHQHDDVTLSDSDGSRRMSSEASVVLAQRRKAIGWRFPPHPTSAGHARRQLRQLLPRWGLLNLLDDAEMLLSETISNAVLHAGSGVRVTAKRTAEGVRIEVTDVGEGIVRPSAAPPTATHGRGLLLVDVLATRWGTAVNAGTKTVWFELADTPN